MATVFCVAVVETTMRGTCVCRTVTTTIPTTVTTTTVCAWLFELRTLNGYSWCKQFVVVFFMKNKDEQSCTVLYNRY